MTNTKIRITMAATLLGGALMLGCAKKSIIKQAEITPSAEPKIEESPKQDDDVEASLRGKDFTAFKDLAIIRFDYDRSEIRTDMTELAAQNANFLKAHPDIEVRVDGHCDQRGTTEYNLALAQRRAAAIRAYYKSLGIAGRRMATQSWGEEKPFCADESEACHSQSRRVETMVRVKETPAPALTPKGPSGDKTK
ncbi:MAG: OmpA family protein [Elusimicrobiota bacterium]